MITSITNIGYVPINYCSVSMYASSMCVNFIYTSTYVMAKSNCASECVHLILSFSSFRATSGVLAFGLVLLYTVSYLNNCFHEEGPGFSNQIINSLSAGLVPPFLCPSPFLTSALIPVSSQGHLVAQNESRRSIF